MHERKKKMLSGKRIKNSNLWCVKNADLFKNRLFSFDSFAYAKRLAMLICNFQQIFHRKHNTKIGLVFNVSKWPSLPKKKNFCFLFIVQFFVCFHLMKFRL